MNEADYFYHLTNNGQSKTAKGVCIRIYTQKGIKGLEKMWEKNIRTPFDVINLKSRNGSDIDKIIAEIFA